MSTSIGTDAKNIALHFVKLSLGRATPAIMKRTINQAKILLESGYSKDEIIKVIDYVVYYKKVEMYSLGYVSACINTMLKEINKEEQDLAKQKAKEEIKLSIASVQEKQRDEVSTDSESAQRNRDKSNRFGVQPRFGKEFTLDLFKE